MQTVKNAGKGEIRKTRLIDADEFIEYLGLDAENAREENIGEIVTLEDFDRQPTAYDMDKVVKELEELRDFKANQFNISKYGLMQMVIEHVKSGGVSKE